MTQFVFASPAHANGGCIFASPGVIDGTPVDRSIAVFAGPAHPNGGCIFANPFEVTDEQRNRNGGTALNYRARIMQEDEEILAVVMAYMAARH